MGTIFDIDSYDYHLPEEQIAQTPAGRRDGSRLLCVDCGDGEIQDSQFAKLTELISAEDVLVVNDTRVFPARLLGKKESGGKAELLLLHYPHACSEQSSAQEKGFAGKAEVEGLVKSSRRPQLGSRLIFGSDLEAYVLEVGRDGSVRVELSWQGNLDVVLNKYGQMPLPPYIHRDDGGEDQDRLRYQTVYARETGAIAAPTAGLHFSDSLMASIKKKGCRIVGITLHVGYGTFAPVRVSDIREHKIHSEYVEVSAETATAIATSKSNGGRVWAVGTTSARALEFAANDTGGVAAKTGPCTLYIYPGYEYKIVDNLITNFHLPKSSLLFMVSAFAGYELVMRSYQQALALGYRFYSYGDAMALIRK